MSLRDRRKHERRRLKDIFVETYSRGQPSGGAPPARQAEANARAEKNAKSSEKKRKTRNIGEVVQDLIGDVHLKLSVQLASREKRGAAKVCNCTVFLPKGQRNQSKNAGSTPAVQ